MVLAFGRSRGGWHILCGARRAVLWAASLKQGIATAGWQWPRGQPQFQLSPRGRLRLSPFFLTIFLQVETMVMFSYQLIPLRISAELSLPRAREGGFGKRGGFSGKPEPEEHCSTMCVFLQVTARMVFTPLGFAILSFTSGLCICVI